MPPKATYRAFEDGELDEWEFVLAETLRMPLGEVRAMPNAEYLQWQIYFARKAQTAQIERFKASKGV